ncbi:Clp protease N-terminal domain-containing protein [Roseisolibacter sp. H3M3-2]|uniref:Clp protease N-terminal domain-containing protein n=1 Tax=Roseisolibacter sp. H3M3-2 TaxID=3031323 RepID=UPI0023DBCA1D|nr:Clp protease N-terminal domain-containing protein [Roseisolibacter sp. H3M3-2]MDF1506208.1 Clp protease N-terminal domain-containing protein [Roseisolibacter sp. H3M3-2]
MAAPDHRLTADADALLRDAGAEADRLRHEYLGTEHLTLALVGRPDGVAGAVLRDVADGAPGVRDTLATVLAPGRDTRAPGAERPFTSRTLEALRLAAAHARALGRDAVGPEHVLLGILAERHNIGAQALAHHGVTLEAALAAVRRLDGGGPARPS